MSDHRLPPFLMASEPGSFAEHTIKVRKPQIIADVLAHNPYPAEIVAALEGLRHEIAAGTVLPLAEASDDAALWRAAWEPWRGRAWSELPWFLAETYFYRRLLEAVGYFRPGPWRLADPFAAQKTEVLATGLQALAGLLGNLDDRAGDEATTHWWLYRSLWGNRVDLSNRATLAAHADTPEHDPAALLVDHGGLVWDLLQSGRIRRLDLVTDNSGLELLSDLGLVDALLERGLVQHVRLHLKPQPYFVSDAMIGDYERTIAALQSSAEAALQRIGARLDGSMRRGALSLATHPFWATHLFFSQLPSALRGELAGADLLVLKGDVNYRRLLEDRHWPPTTRLEEVTQFMPTSTLSLRTLKAEIMVGLAEGQAERLDREDPTWRINGRRGLVHLVRRE